ncbi:hypothetical protein CHUAL_009227 [Chamberlinius hualienensis]
MAAPKGKTGTKGQKQILDENKQTIQFYFWLGTGASAAYILFYVLLFWNSVSTTTWIMFIISTAIYVGAVQFMTYMAKAKFSETGQLLDGGLDLNMESGVAEHVKDVVILTAVSETLSLISNYFWLLLLFAPARATYLLWTTVLGPWFFQSTPEEEKKSLSLKYIC